MKYKNWLDEWLISYVKPTTKERTYERYAQTIKVHILPKLGDYELDDLTPMVLQRYINELLTAGNAKTGKGLSSNFINGVISVIKSSLKTAVMFGIKKTYDMDKLRRPKQESKKVECFTVSEQKKIENAVMTQKSKLFGIVLCLYTGLRIGELLALTWSDIDLTKSLLIVNKTCHDGNVEGKHVRITDTPKTKTSNRVIPIPKQLIPKLRELKRKKPIRVCGFGRAANGLCAQLPKVV